ncbi:MAG TPA: efflux RND transporter permease subunit [Polyangiaceae bacterium]
MRLLALLRHYAVVVWLTTAVLVCLGVACAYGMPSGIYPEIEFPRVVVVARTGGAPPDVFLTQVTRPLEQALTATLGLERIRSKTIRGATEISLQFSPTTEMWRALQMVESKVSEARSALPGDSEVIVEKVTTGSFPVVTFNVGGPLDPRELRELAELVIRPALANVPGVGRIEVVGGDVREYEVVLDPRAALALKLNPEDVAAKLRSNLSLHAVGRVQNGQQLVTVLGDAQPRTLSELRDLPIATSAEGGVIPLSAIAEVVEGAEDRTVRVGGPRGNTVAISVARMPGASTPEVVDSAIAAISALAPSLPEGARIDPVYDQARLVREAMTSVRDAILIGILLCALVIAVFLRDVRAGFQAALAVPLTLAVTFVCMKIAHQTLNLMSLGGMAVAIGLVVDDAIVIVEAIAHHRDHGADPERAAALGTAELAPAVIGTTLTTVVVLIPLSFLDGIVGDFFRALGFTLTCAVLISLVVALALIPLWGVGKARPQTLRKPRFSRLYQGVSGLFLGRPLLAVALVAVNLALGVWIYPHLERGFLPTMDERAFVVDYFLPAGTSLETTDAFARGIERELSATAEVQTFSRRLGAELGPAAATQLNRGDIMVRLKPSGGRSYEDIVADVRARLGRKYPEVRVEFVQVLQDVLNDLAGSPRPVEVKLFGPDYAELDRLGDQLAERMGQIPGVVDVYAGHEHEVPELRFRAARDTLARLGLSSDDFDAQLAAALHGSIVGAMRRFDRLINIRVRYPNLVRFDPAQIPDLPVSMHDRALTFRALATPELSTTAAELTHEALQPMVAVTADHEGRDLGAVADDIGGVVSGLHLPRGYRAVVAGQIQGQQATLRNLAWVAALAALLVLTVLSAQFRYLRFAFLVLGLVPLAIVGAFVGLLVTATPLNASSLMGAVLLVGLVVKNGVLLLEEAEKRFASGEPASAAIAGAAERRLRPVLMTTIATLVGLLPLALGIGAGADLQKPLAIAVIFGLASSTVATLVVLPSLSLLVLRRATRKAAS